MRTYFKKAQGVFPRELVRVHLESYCASNVNHFTHLKNHKMQH
jgi:hypothetical protein